MLLPLFSSNLQAEGTREAAPSESDFAMLLTGREDFSDFAVFDYSRSWAFRTPVEDGSEAPDCSWDRRFNGTLYSYTSDGFISRIDFTDSGFQGLSFTVAFNTTGPGNSGNIMADRRSVPAANVTDKAAGRLIFLNEPDP